MKQTVLVIIALALGLLTLSPVWAWEERLKECRDLGVSEKDCPETGPIIVPKPVTPGIPENTTFTGNPGKSGINGRTTYTKWVWVFQNITYMNPKEKICYNAHLRRIQYFSDHTETVNLKTTKNECTLPKWHTINLVFDK